MPRWAHESTEGYRWRPLPSRTAACAPSWRGWPPLLVMTNDELREAILYRIVLTPSRQAPAAQAYLARRASEGKTRREAVLARKRFVVRAIWRRWQECLALEAAPVPLAA